MMNHFVRNKNSLLIFVLLSFSTSSIVAFLPTRFLPCNWIFQKKKKTFVIESVLTKHKFLLSSAAAAVLGLGLLFWAFKKNFHNQTDSDSEVKKIKIDGNIKPKLLEPINASSLGYYNKFESMSKDGKFFLVSEKMKVKDKQLFLTEENKLFVYDVENQSKIFFDDFHSNQNFFFSPNSSFIAVAFNKNVQLYGIAAKKKICSINLDQKVQNLSESSKIEYLCFSPDEEIMLLDIGNRLILYDIKNDEIVMESKDVWRQDVFKHDALCFSNCGNFFAYEISEKDKNNSEIIVYDIKNKKEKTFSCDEDYKIVDLCFSPCGSLLACSLENFDQNNKCLIYDIKTKQEKYHYCGDFPIKKICFSPSGRLISFGTSDGKVAIYDIKKDKQTDLYSHVTKGQDTLVSYTDGANIVFLQFSPDSSFVISGCDNKLILYDRKKRKKTHVCRLKRKGFANSANIQISSHNYKGLIRIAVSSDYKKITSVGVNGETKIYKIPDEFQKRQQQYVSKKKNKTSNRWNFFRKLKN